MTSSNFTKSSCSRNSNSKLFTKTRVTFLQFSHLTRKASGACTRRRTASIPCLMQACISIKCNLTRARIRARIWEVIKEWLLYLMTSITTSCHLHNDLWMLKLPRSRRQTLLNNYWVQRDLSPEKMHQLPTLQYTKIKLAYRIWKTLRKLERTRLNHLLTLTIKWEWFWRIKVQIREDKTKYRCLRV